MSDAEVRLGIGILQDTSEYKLKKKNEDCYFIYLDFVFH